MEMILITHKTISIVVISNSIPFHLLSKSDCPTSSQQTLQNRTLEGSKKTYYRYRRMYWHRFVTPWMIRPD